MELMISETRPENGRSAADVGAALIREALAVKGAANIILATGASQFEMLEVLQAAEGIDWHRVTMFHLDEYVGLPITHPASFRAYLWQRFVRGLPVPPAAFHFVDGDVADAAAECRRLGAIIREHPIDVAFIGIGENGHLAFNDPPADFETDEPFLVVTLDEACRRQQLGEGWFPDLASVPERAISMSIRQILQAETIICTVPDTRKAVAVREAVDGPLTPRLPASILRTHPKCTLFLDQPAAALLGARCK
jgi:glucosamine-6-phosphate deaminase